MIKVVSFDIGGTILISENIKEYNLKRLTELTNKPYEEVRNVYKLVFQKEKGALTELVNRFCSNLNISLTAEIFVFFQEKFKEQNNLCHTNKNIKIILKKIKELNYKIILFSNSCYLVKNTLDADLLANIDDIFYSYDYGYTKDEEEIYKIIETKLRCKSEEILHIGDTLSSDYLLPRKMGWNAVYYGNIEDPEIYSIQNLEEIFNVLDNLSVKYKNVCRKE